MIIIVFMRANTYFVVLTASCKLKRSTDLMAGECPHKRRTPLRLLAFKISQHLDR